MKRLLIVLVLVSGLSVILYQENDSDEIHMVFDEIAQNGSFEGEFHPIESLALAKETTKSFDDSFRLTLMTTSDEKVVIRNEKELRQKVILARTHLSQLAVGLFDRDIEIVGDSAIVKGTARGMGRSNGREDYFLEEHPVRIELEKTGGKWKIVNARNTEAIEWPYE